MKLTAQTKLVPTQAQFQALQETLELANQACNAVSEISWEHKAFRQVPLHRLAYYPIREQFGLSAQVTVRCIRKVVGAYKQGRKTQRTFRPHGAIAYDARILRWDLAGQTVSIWTVAGRQHIPFVCGEGQRQLLENQQGESDLCYVDGHFSLMASCEVEAPELEVPQGFLGVDLGIVNLAVDSEGEVFSGKEVTRVRANHHRLRRKLQKKGTKGAKRLLKKRARKERRFATHTNHGLSKQLVEKAQRTKQGLALEDLQGLRQRVRVSRSQRRRLHSWAFHQLRRFLSYKAQRAGVVVVLVDPRNTSRGCSKCGHVSKKNRKTRETFLCEACGYAAPADFNAACNLAGRAAVNQPDYSLS